MSGNISLATVTVLFDHNYWARDRQLEACSALTEEQLLRPLGSSFSSLRDTLVHLLAVEWLWLERWRGRSPRTLLSALDLPTLAAISTRWRVVEREMRQYLAGLSEPDLSRPLGYLNTRGKTYAYPLSHMILHLFSHQNYHRGQVTALLRQLDAQPPTVDFLYGYDKGFGA